jgi:DNA-binding transcriptional MerR regulator/methylmalonyl-CoA mutase cobalamin-binding subunit
VEEIQHSIKVASRRCGLSTHVIRVWEKRYDAVSPNRTDTNRRQYSEEEIERLSLLRLATLGGHSIGNIAKLPTDRLKALVETDARSQISHPKTELSESLLDGAIETIRSLDASGLETVLGKAALKHGHHGMLEQVIAPLTAKVGELWLHGEITAAHEHFASAIIRNHLVRQSKPYATRIGAPTIIVTTPSGQLHELGAVMVAAAAKDMDWHVIYLGPSLPAAEIAGAAIQHKARAVALSIVFPTDDTELPEELNRLRQLLPDETKLLVGGRAAKAYERTLKTLGAHQVRELRELYPLLESFRNPQAEQNG